MIFKYDGKVVRGILAVLPDREVAFEDEMGQFNFSAEQSLRLKKVMGYDRHRIVSEGTCASDLAVFGLSHLFQTGQLDRDTIDALIVVTQSPDYFMPPTSSVIQGRLELRHDMLCLDLCQGCAGFVMGLLQAFAFLEQESVKRVVLVNVDVLSRKTSPKDRNSYPLIGDGAAITVIEKDPAASTIHCRLKMDGTRSSALMIPAGGFRLPSSPDTALLNQDESGNSRALDHLVMKGDAVFNFVQAEVPGIIEDVVRDAQLRVSDIDYFLCHQPNRFMLRKLADKLGVGYDKMPNNVVENYGNGSSVTIPFVATHNLARELCERTFSVCLAGFGVGLTWTAMCLRLGDLRFCEKIEYRFSGASNAL